MLKSDKDNCQNGVITFFASIFASTIVSDRISQDIHNDKRKK